MRHYFVTCSPCLLLPLPHLFANVVARGRVISIKEASQKAKKKNKSEEEKDQIRKDSYGEFVWSNISGTFREGKGFAA